MKRRLALPLVALGLVLSAVLAVAALNNPDQNPVYGVADLQARLAYNPAAWVGRTVLLRGRVIFHHHRIDHNTLLTETDLANASIWSGGELRLAPGPEDPLLGALRRLPLVGRLMPPPRTAQWGTVSTYHVRLRAPSAAVCGYSPCYEALLLDAAPDSL